MAIRNNFGLNVWIPERLRILGMTERQFLDTVEGWSPCYFGYYDYAEALEGLTVSDLWRVATVLGTSPLELLQKDYEMYKGRPLREIIRTRREDLNLSLEELSNASNYESTVIEALEAGSDDVGLHALREIACALEIPLEFLLERI